MAIETMYYIDGATFDVATSVYLNSDLSLIAPDGVYKFGTITRQQSSGILLTVETCETCATPCGTTISGSGSGIGIYSLNINAGNSIGAVIIKFNPNSIPDGIRAVYNGTNYNKLSSPNWGELDSPNEGNFTIVGSITSDCGLEGNTTYNNYPQYLYDEATSSFLPYGAYLPYTILPTDVFLRDLAVGECVMVIPKITSSPNNILVQFIGPCSSTGFNFSIGCPVSLPSFLSSSQIVPFPPSVEPPCSTPINQTHYYAKVNNTVSSLQVRDYVFTDPNGQYPLTDGYYYFNYTSGTVIGLYRVINGIVTNLNYTSCT